MENQILGVEENFNEDNLSNLVDRVQEVNHVADDVDYMEEQETNLEALKAAQTAAIGGGTAMDAIRYSMMKKKPLVKWTEDHPKIGRNDPCPCGSGLKYKKCCGAA